MRAAHCCGSFHLLPYSLVLQVLHWYFISAGFPEVLLCNLFLAGFRYCFTLVSTFGGIPLLFYTGIYFWRDFSTVLLWYMFSAGFLYHPTLVQVFSGILRSSSLMQVIGGISQSSSLMQVISGTSISRQFPAGIIRKGSVRSRVLRFRLRDARLLAASRFNSPLRAQT